MTTTKSKEPKMASAKPKKVVSAAKSKSKRVLTKKSGSSKPTTVKKSAKPVAKKVVKKPVAKKPVSRSKSAQLKKTAAKAAVSLDALREAIEQVRPALHSHGGDIELVGLEGDEVIVRLTGACQGCPMAAMTLKQGVEKFLVKRVPGLKSVKAA